MPNVDAIEDPGGRHGVAIAAKPKFEPQIEAKSEPRHAARRVVRAVGWAVAVGVLVAGSVQAIRFAKRPPEVFVVTAKAEDVSRMLAVTGRIEAERTVLVSPQVSGRITEIVRREGDRVNKGDVLARLADPSAKSDVTQQEATLASKEHELAQAERDFARTSSLVRSGSIAAAELESAQLVVSRMTEDMRRLSAAVGEERSRLVLRAPFDGTIVRREGELGQVVGSASTVFEIATADAVRVSAEIDERYVGALRAGMRAEILPVGADGPALRATLAYIARAVDPQTGAATVRFAYESPPRDALIGMSVDVNVSVQTVVSAIVIPREAVGGGADRPFLLLAIDGRVARRDVVLDDWPASLVVVRSGLKPGDLALVDPKGAKVGASVRTKATPDGF